MKILSATQIRETDVYTIENEPIASIDLMERAATRLFDWFIQKFPDTREVKIFCGVGNNGGDGLALARLLHQKGYKIETFAVRYSDQSSNDFQVNEERLKEIKEIAFTDIIEDSELPSLDNNVVVVDALWGSGLSRSSKGFATKVSQHINNSKATVVAVDIPSGLFADKYSEGITVEAGHTVSFELPKLAFMYPENYGSVGEWIALSIGLDMEFISKQVSFNEYVTTDDIRDLIKQRKKFDHKGTFGHGLIISGSYGKMGAAVLAAEACLRSGTGLVTAHIPKCGYEIMQSTLPEAMVSLDKDESYFTEAPVLEKYTGIGIGPGIDTKDDTQNAFSELLKSAKAPLVIDADGINILAKNKDYLKYLPESSILTPHPKEFERLLGKSSNDFERQKTQLNFAKEYKVILILKGAQTAIGCPDGKCYFNSTGNPGMATAGSGDVLTGIITGILSQGYDPVEAAILGVFLHGFAGDLAAKEKTMETMIAGDIIKHLQDAFREISD